GRYVLEEALPPRAGVARWHARDRLLERPVMVGEVRLDPGMDEAERARASRAAGRATGIQVLDVVCEGDRLYVVTPAETPVTEFATLETPTVVVAEPTAVLPFAAPPLASAAARRRR